MNKRHIFVNNLIYAFAAQGASLLLSVLMSLVVPKILGLEEFSFWQLFIFYSTYVGFSHFGLADGIYLRYGGAHYEELDKSLLGSQFWLMVLWQMLLAVMLISLSLLFISDSRRVFVLSCTAVFMVLNNSAWFLGCIFQAVNDTKLFSLSVLIDKFFFIIAVLLLIFIRPDNFKVFVTLFVVSKTTALAYCCVKGREIIFASLIPFNDAVKAAMGNIGIGINLMFANIASMLIIGGGRFIVDARWGIRAFGKFSFAVSLTMFFLQFISQVAMVLFPALRRNTRDEQVKIYVLSRHLLSCLLCGVLLAYIPVKMLLNWWLPQYAESFSYLAILLPLCVFDGKMQMLGNTYLKVLRKERALLKINVAAMAASLALSVLGAYVVKDIYFIVFAMLFAIAFRSCIAERYLARLMNLDMGLTFAAECALSITFIVAVNLLPSYLSLYVYASVYAAYLWTERGYIMQAARYAKRVARG